MTAPSREASQHNDALRMLTDVPALLRLLPGLVRMTRKVWTHPANRHRRLLALGRAAAFQIRGRLGRESIIPIGERSRIWASLDSDATLLAAYANPPDLAQVQVWRRQLAPGDLFVDVGANVGTYTVLMAERGVNVIALEPDAENAAKVERNLALNGYEAVVVRKALAAEPGYIQFTRSLDSENHVVITGQGRDTYEVECDTLDRVIGDSVVHGLKVDVEGAERLVMEGARLLLSERRLPLIQLEWNSLSENLLGESREPLAKLLAGYGYELFRPREDGTLVPVTDFGPSDTDLFARPS